MTDTSTRIQNILTELAGAATFYPRSYNPTTNLAYLSSTPAASPQVFVNEVSGRYSPDMNQGREAVVKADVCVFSLILQFTTEVSADAFIRSLWPMIRLPKDADSPGMRLYLATHNAKHPPRQQSSNGTVLSLVFNGIPDRL